MECTFSDIEGEDGAIANEPLPLENYDWLQDIQLESSQKSQNSNKPQQPTGEFKDIGNDKFQYENSFFLGLQLKEDSLNNDINDIINMSPNEEIEYIEYDEAQMKENKAEEDCSTKKKVSKKGCNETKNIPKNFGKQILKFIIQHQQIVKKVLLKFDDINYHQFQQKMKLARKKINKLSDLKSLWIDHQYAIPVRVLSEHFIRKYSYQWIFNSRVQNIQHPIKYRNRIIQGMRRPQGFIYLKEY